MAHVDQANASKEVKLRLNMQQHEIEICVGLKSTV